MNDAGSNLGGPKGPIALLEKPYCSVGRPKKLVSNFWFSFESINKLIAYVPAGISSVSI